MAERPPWTFVSTDQRIVTAYQIGLIEDVVRAARAFHDRTIKENREKLKAALKVLGA
jgi:hypothetical protein